MRLVHPARAHALLLAGSTLCCLGLLLAGEWVVRRLGPERIRLSPARSAIVHSPLYGWQLRPNWAQRDEHGRLVSTDSARRRVQPPARPTATPRIAVLGDSVAFGAGVDDTETFASRLAAREGWTIANFAVPGWGIDQSVLRYEHEGRLWHPAVVVLNVCLANDLADNMLAYYLYDPAWPKPYFTLQDGELRHHADHLVRARGRRAWRWLFENSHLLNLLAAPPSQGRRELAHWMGRRRHAVKDEAAASQLAVREIQRLQAAAGRERTALVVALHPDRAAFEGRSTLAIRLHEALEAARVRTLDLGERYRAGGWAFADLTLDGLGHLSPQGHAVAADLIRDEIRNRTERAAPGSS